ncbi:MAG: DUF2911 domain-containing protein [Gemmatimonadota bacterium]
MPEGVDADARRRTLRRRTRSNVVCGLVALATAAAVAACAGAPDTPDRSDASDRADGEEEAEEAEAATDGLERLPDGSMRGSQPAVVRQRMGATEIAVVHNRPSARGRELFGGLVAYDEIWNPGADEATRIELSRDVFVEDERLPAGRYSIWTIPRPDEWTVIFSRAYDVYHRPYPEGRDALRLDVRPREGPWMESLAFYFPAATRDSAELVLHWGTTVVPLALREADR